MSETRFHANSTSCYPT